MVAVEYRKMFYISYNFTFVKQQNTKPTCSFNFTPNNMVSFIILLKN